MISRLKQGRFFNHLLGSNLILLMKSEKDHK